MAESAQDVRRMALGVITSRLMDGRQLMDEFRSVLGRDPTIRFSQAAAHASCNQNKNRYSNVLPYDLNRVILQPCSCSDGARGAVATNGCAAGTAVAAFENRGRTASSATAAPAPQQGSPDPTYINASHVIHDDAQCGFSVRYIACQGPLPSTEADFWRMCWGERVGAVVMLTNVVERGINKCSTYYPAQPGARLVLRGGGGGGSGGLEKMPPSAAGSAACVEEVMAVSSSSLHAGELTYTVLRLSCSGCGGASSRDVTHLQYNAWPDHGTPADASAIRTMCDMVEPVRGAGGAVVVHCSAGIGRTGTFCAIDIMRRRLAYLEACAASRPGNVRADAVQAALDLPELVHSLRRQRSGMVQTIEQYVFCYQAIYEELLASLNGTAVGGAGAGAGGGTNRSGGGTRAGGGARTPTRQVRR